MAKGILLGIDLGTSVLKVCAFDGQTGAVLAQGSKPLRVISLPDGGREQSPLAVDRAFGVIVRGLRGRLGVDCERVRGIGLAAQGGSSIIADRATGKALTPMVLWNDGRAHAHAARIEAETGREVWQRYTLRDFVPHGLGRMAWLKEREPDLFREENIHVGAGEYLFHRLTGQWRQDAGNAIQVGSYNAATKQLHEEALDLIGVPQSFVAPLRQGHETAGLSAKGARLLGLPEGLPVAGPYIDQEAGYLSAAGVSKRPLQCSLGTAWVGNFAAPPGANPGVAHQFVLPNLVGDGDLVILALLTGNTTWDWALDTLVGGERGKALRKAAKILSASLLPPAGLTVLPYLTQRNLLDSVSYGGGVFSGVSAETTPDDLLRAVVAGMVFELGRVFLPIAHSGTIDSIVLGGGASKGSFFRRLIATLFAPLPVYQQTDEDLAAARGATFALGWKSARSKTVRVKGVGRAFARDVRRAYEDYVRLYECVVRPDFGGIG